MTRFMEEIPKSAFFQMKNGYYSSYSFENDIDDFMILCPLP